MIYIGIDISKYKHDCFIATESAPQAFSFENTMIGFKLLLSKLTPYVKAEMIIGLEATGHYGENLKSFLMLHGYTFMEINPFLVKKFSQAHSLRKTKTDKKDAKLISAYMTSVDYKAYHHQSYHIQALKSLTRLRSKLVSARTRHYNLLTKTLDVTFPEFRPFMKDVGYSKTSLYLLKRFCSPFKIAKLTDKHYVAIRKISMGKFSYPKFIKLKNLAANTIGVSRNYQDMKIKMLISYIEKFTSDITQIEDDIVLLMKSHPTYIQTIKGIGLVTAAIIICEYGNLSLFRSPAQMLSYAGLDFSISQSGTQSSTGKIVKRGSKHLRSALVNATMMVMIHNPVFYAYYNKKKQEGKHHRVAQIHLARKLIRVIHHLEIKKVPFDASLLK